MSGVLNVDLGNSHGPFCCCRDVCQADSYCTSKGGYLPTQITSQELANVYPQMLSVIGPNSPTVFFTDGFNDQKITAWRSNLLPSPLSAVIQGSGDCVALDIVARTVTRVSCTAIKLPTVCLRLLDATATATTTTPNPATSACPPKQLPGGKTEAQVPRYVQLQGKQTKDLSANLLQRVSANSGEECAQLCNAAGAQCKAFVLDGGRSCWLFSKGAVFETDLTSLPTSSYFQRLCVPASKARPTLLIWPVVPQMVLVGYAIAEVPAASLKDCMEACVARTSPKVCNSGMFYPTELLSNTAASCILNFETRQSQPQVFAKERFANPMYYFDVGRGPGVKTTPRRQAVLKTSRREVSLLQLARRSRTKATKTAWEKSRVRSSQWTSWSSCETTTTGIRYRYKPCGRRLIYKCPRQFGICPGSLVQMSPS